MTYPRLFQRLFTNSGKGPELNENIIPSTITKEMNINILNVTTANVDSLNLTSDRNLKTELNEIRSSLDKIKLLTGYTYTLLTDNKVHAGLVAQDVEKVLPEAVTIDDNDIKRLDYNAVLAMVVNAIKELDNKIDSINQNK